MQEVFENIIERLEENQTIVFHLEGGKPTQSIDLVKAIEIINQAAAEYDECYECKEYNKEKHYCPKFCEVITDAVKEIEENHNGWIPCSEWLPNYGESVLVSFNKAIQPLIATLYENDTWKMLQGVNGLVDITNDVIAWQPLPDPYQPKGE